MTCGQIRISLCELCVIGIQICVVPFCNHVVAGNAYELRTYDLPSVTATIGQFSVNVDELLCQRFSFDVRGEVLPYESAH